MVLKFLGSFYILMSVECFLGPDLLVPNIPHFILLSAASGHFSRELSKLAVSTQSFHCTPFKPFGLGKPSWFFGSLKFFKPGNPISEGACWFGTLTHALEGAFFTRSPHSLYLGSPCVTPTVRCIVWRSARATPATPATPAGLAGPATQMERRCHQVPRLPGKGNVDVAKCHACHAKCRSVTHD